MENIKNIAIILCSGIGKRMKIDKPKQFLEINDKPIICYTIEKFEQCEKINEIILVTNKEYIDFVNQEIIKKYNYKKIKKVAEGGEERIFSVYNGIKEIEDTNKENIILIHDGVRPFIKIEHIEKIIQETKKNNACILGVKAKDTIKICMDNIIKSTPNRENMWIAQTPQVFKFDIIKEAYEKAISKNFIATDDASVVELMGENVFMVEGDYENIKITTKDDLKFFNN